MADGFNVLPADLVSGCATRRVLALPSPCSAAIWQGVYGTPNADAGSIPALVADYHIQAETVGDLRQEMRDLGRRLDLMQSELDRAEDFQGELAEAITRAVPMSALQAMQRGFAVQHWAQAAGFASAAEWEDALAAEVARMTAEEREHRAASSPADRILKAMGA